MQLINETEALTNLKTVLNKQFRSEPFTESTIEKIQDSIELALVTYSDDDVANYRFLNAHSKETGLNKSLELFINADIYVEVIYKTKISDGFQQIDDIEDVRILKADSLS